MFYTGIIITATVPLTFYYAGSYFNIFKKYYIPFCVIFMIAGVFSLIILLELRRMFCTVIQGNPFVKNNVSSLKRMGACAFAITLCMVARLFFVITPAEMVLALVFLIAGLFSLVLSLVFDQAVIYKQENDLTI
jgi:hypothetical protein